MADRIAAILGASGSVGQALLAEIVRCGEFSRVLVFVRRPLEPPVPAAVQTCLVPRMEPEPLGQVVAEALRGIDAEVTGFSVLGIGAGTAKLTIAQHRAVDVELNAAFARGLKASGKVRHLAFMSAVGADSNASTTGSGAAGMPRYARVKGESEAAVVSQGPQVVSIFRPGMIIGSRHTPKILEWVLPMLGVLTPANYRSIRTSEIAEAMVAAALQPLAQTAVYHYPQMMALRSGRQG